MHIKKNFKINLKISDITHFKIGTSVQKCIQLGATNSFKRIIGLLNHYSLMIKLIELVAKIIRIEQTLLCIYEFCI